MSEKLKKLFWACPSGSCNESRSPQLLKSLRFLNSGLCLGMFLMGFPFFPEIYFIYLTHWGVVLTFLFNCVSLASLVCKRADPVAYLLFEVAWTVEWVVTLLFWTTIAPLVSLEGGDLVYNFVVHILPMALLLLDFSLNRILFLRDHYSWVAALMLVYVLGVNLPVTLTYQTVYPLITYDNAWTYLILLAAVLIAAGFFELAVYIKKRQFLKRHSLLITL